MFVGPEGQLAVDKDALGPALMFHSRRQAEEFFQMMNAAMRGINADPYRTYRIYEKEI